MTHWDMFHKENSNLVALFNMFQCVSNIVIQFGDFVPHHHSAANDPSADS